MADELKVLSPEVIADQPFPNQDETATTQVSQVTGDTTTPNTTKIRSLPVKKVAHELLASALNTKSRKILAAFEFTESGALQIGKYENGVSGDLRVTPNGLTARDKAGITTFSIDAETGDAVFKGTIQAGSVISEGEIIGGLINIVDRFIVDSDGSLKVYDNTGSQVLISENDTGFVGINSLKVGQGISNSGMILVYDSNIEIFRVDVDAGLKMGVDKTITLRGTTAANAPDDNSAVLYVDQSGGKDRLMVRFNSGAAQQLAIEP